MPLFHKYVKTNLTKKFLGAIKFHERLPTVIEGPGSVIKAGELCAGKGMTKMLVVTDDMLMGIGLLDSCLGSLKDNGVDFVVYDKVTPDPTIEQILQGSKLYSESKCSGIIAFGGGSSMDCAKMIGAHVVNPKPIESYAGSFKILSPLPYLIAIPTTAGTGSEVTFAAVVRDEVNGLKFLVTDLVLTPRVAILDPELLTGLPKSVTAATGMDALTHAVEAFVGPWRSQHSAEFSKRAIKGVFENLQRSFDNPNDIEARMNMQKAAFDAGVAISIGGVSYVHAISHTVGGRFHVPHGVANAMFLPKMLRFYDEAIHDSLAELAVYCGMGKESEGKDVLAKRFVEKVENLHASLSMPTTVKGMTASDIPSIATRALQEGHGDLHSVFWRPLSWFADAGYPIPKYMTQQDCEEILHTVLETPAARL